MGEKKMQGSFRLFFSTKLQELATSKPFFELPIANTPDALPLDHSNDQIGEQKLKTRRRRKS
jgi:hypothetical protein